MIELYHQHAKTVYNLALQYVQNKEDAEEITQDVFVKVHENRHRFKQQSDIKTWIYRITINTCLDFIKARKRQKRFGIFQSLFNGFGNEPLRELSEFNHPGVILEHKEATAKLFRLINQLPDNQKTALILAKIEDKTHKEIAAIMELSEKAVESLIVRAKKSLAQKIAASNEGNEN